MTLSRLTAVAVATLAAACASTALAAPASAAPASSCATAGYSYGGVQTPTPQRGISARVTATRISAVTSGHIAGWVGVGGAGQGPNGSDEWLQIGISSVPGGETEIYYEIAHPGKRAAYTRVASIAAGHSRVLGVYEIAPSTWVATVNGRAVSRPVKLPGSHETWHGQAVAESYDGGVTACNSYGIRFADLRAATFSGTWAPVKKAQSFSSGGHALRTVLSSSSLLVSRW